MLVSPSWSWLLKSLAAAGPAARVAGAGCVGMMLQSRVLVSRWLMLVSP